MKSSCAVLIFTGNLLLLSGLCLRNWGQHPLNHRGQKSRRPPRYLLVSHFTSHQITRLWQFSLLDCILHFSPTTCHHLEPGLQYLQPRLLLPGIPPPGLSLQSILQLCQMIDHISSILSFSYSLPTASPKSSKNLFPAPKTEPAQEQILHTCRSPRLLNIVFSSLGLAPNYQILAPFDQEKERLMTCKRNLAASTNSRDPPKCILCRLEPVNP